MGWILAIDTMLANQHSPSCHQDRMTWTPTCVPIPIIIIVIIIIITFFFFLLTTLVRSWWDLYLWLHRQVAQHVDRHFS